MTAVLLAAIADPAGASRWARHSARPLPPAALILVLASCLGLATIPRQLAILARAFPVTGSASGDALHAAFIKGLTRLIVIDRVVPPPTVLLAGVLLVVAADPVLALARNRRPELWAVMVLGLVPLIPLRLGELLVTWLTPVAGHPTAGFATLLPRQFATGLDLFWPTPAPTVVEALSGRLNAFTLWSVAIWTIGLREMDQGRFAPWQLLLPLACLGGAAAFTWVVEGPVVTAILGSP